MKWLLDTNVISETMRVRPSRVVLSWIRDIPTDKAAISIITIAEIRAGALAASNDEKRAEIIHWLEQTVMPWLADGLLPLNEEILIDWLLLSRKLAAQGITREAADILLASTARTHKLTLATRNVSDFANTGVVVYDPWHDQTHRMDEP